MCARSVREMRSILCVTVVAGVVAGGGVANATEVTIIQGGGALGSYEQLSDDGCVLTYGEIAVVKARVGGELADGLYVTGVRDDLCDDAEGWGYAGFVEGSVTVIDLVYARFVGSGTITSYNSGEPFTVDLDLRWFGKGPVTWSGGQFHDGTTIDFNFSASRNATTAGRFEIDGDPADVTSASLISQASGHLAR
jgi:hypothetical protein